MSDEHPDTGRRWPTPHGARGVELHVEGSLTLAVDAPEYDFDRPVATAQAMLGQSGFMVERAWWVGRG